MIFIGDVHGRFRSFLDLLMTLEEPTFQVGDMGMGSSKFELPELDAKNRFIRGNHDDPEKCKAHKNYAGEYGYDEKENMFFVGGAYSVDWQWRVAVMEGRHPHHLRADGPIWWRDEELSKEELEKATEQYKEIKPKIMVSHECPSSVVDPLVGPMLVGNGWGHVKPSRTARALQIMFRIHRPELWVCGHYHFNREVDVRGTHFVCCAELSCWDSKNKEFSLRQQ